MTIALRDGEALDLIPLYQATLIVTGAASGALVLQEQATNSTGRVVAYCLSLLLVTCGLALIAAREATARRPDQRRCTVHDRVVAIRCYDTLAAKVCRHTSGTTRDPQSSLRSRAVGSRPAAIYGSCGRAALPLHDTLVLPSAAM